tara:strand:+ start:4738 stop:5628 length:891 start_codon:yes stop_codon:yes gene_type:complete
MAKDNKIRNVTVKQDDGTEIKITVKRPAGRAMADAQRVSAKVWTDCVRDKIMTKKELNNFLYSNGIWDKKKDLEQVIISEQIQEMEKQLYTGGDKSKEMKASDAKDLAIQMRIKRIELRDLIAEKMELEQNTAEAIADNAKFDFLVARSTFFENGETVYKDVEDYEANADSPIGSAAASALAEMLYALDKNFEANLPENKFLTSQHMVNEELSLVDDEGNTVDTKGRRINEFGHYLNDKGQRTDLDGNLLDEEGNYIPSVTYIDDIHENTAIDEEEATKPKPKRAKKKVATSKSSR